MIRRIWTLPGMFVVALLTLGLSIAWAQVAPTTVSEGSSLMWDHTGQNFNGDPIMLAHAEVELLDANGATVKTERVDTGAGKAPPFRLNTFLADVSEGSYSARVRVLGVNGVWSPWSAPLELRVDRAAPAAPVNLRGEVTVTVTVTVGG